MHFSQPKLCTSKTELALEMNFISTLTEFTWPKWRTLTKEIRISAVSPSERLLLLLLWCTAGNLTPSCVRHKVRLYIKPRARWLPHKRSCAVWLLKELCWCVANYLWGWWFLVSSDTTLEYASPEMLVRYSASLLSGRWLCASSSGQMNPGIHWLAGIGLEHVTCTW